MRWEGIFWTDSEPEPVPGGVEMPWFEPGTLSLERLLLDAHGQIVTRPETMRGETHDGRSVLLENVFSRRYTIATNRRQRHPQELNVSHALVGEIREDGRYHGMRVKWEQLPDFLPRSGLEFDNEQGSVRWTKPEPPVQVEAGGVTIEFTERRDLHAGFRSARLSHEVAVEMTAAEQLSVDEWIGKLQVLHTFLGFSLGDPPVIDSVALLGPNGEEVVHRYTVRASQRRAKPRTWLTAFHWGPALPEAMAAWFRFAAEEPAAFILISEYIDFSQALNWSDRLLYLARFVEVHHRHRRKGGQISKSEHRARVLAVVDAAPAEHQDWLRKALEFSNELTLNQRLTEMLAGLDQQFGLHSDRIPLPSPPA